MERERRRVLAKERERARKQQHERGRDRSARQRDAPDTAETDNQRRVRQRQVQQSEYRHQRQKREDEQKAYVASCIAAGEMVPLQCDNMQFLDDEERDQFDRLCPHGYPYTKMVSTKMMLHGGGVGSLHPQVHVRLMLYAHKAVRVQGQVVGYGGGALRMRRVDTCATMHLLR